nr:SH3 domain-containing protein [uncultured Lachnoclostridium sp.]
MAKYTQSQMDILIKIIATVETGGQVYGQARYDDYTPAYANCSNEISCTIGAFQEYGSLAKGLLQEILNTYPSTFRKYDNAGIETDLKRTSWTGYSPAKGSSKAKAIQAIISSANGIKIQNSRIQKQMESHIAFAQKQGVSDVDALFMCANFIHQGGQSACTRILKKTQKPYTLDHLYEASKSDTGNQVGAYKTRQQKVYGWLKEKISNKNISNNNSQGSDNMATIVQKVINDAVSFAVGIANDNSHGYSQAVRSLYNITNPKSFDCSSLCCTAYYYAFLKNGLTEQANYLKAHCSYTGNMLNMTNVGFEIVARNQTAHAQMEKGDLELNVNYHVAMAIDKDNIVHARSSEGTTNTIDDSGNEIRTQGWYLYSHKWDYRLRFTGKGINLNNVKPSANTTTSTYKKWVGVATKDGTDVFANVTGTTKLSTYPKLNKGNLVDVIGESGTKYQVKIADKYTGYVEKSNIKDPNAATTKPSTSTAKSTYPFVGEVTASELNVRTGAGINYGKSSSYPILKKGNLVDVLKSVKDSSGAKWYQIRIAGKYTGYVSAQYIKKK